MRRRALDDPAAIAPAWVRTYDPAAWADPADEITAEFRDLAEQFGPHIAREVRACTRWSDACRRWCDEHGVTLKAARR
ncbi:hypothetical protein CLV30_11768 [Haloactinopolyspora alba]|uniref:Uncharacterized protein n=1 Tax=Haloactinopolyspora alba TaxID=648780 RepID=A0A2P8DRC6_9ACTN|nr:hypothetical protein [Haloactinopolyspora alba]PSK99765.1 hypothetical protein CLV30_11768 [Haloactinopolyspora alba]